MIVVCPKCKIKLKVTDEKLTPEGTRFKCPRCSAVLLVRKPPVQIKPLEDKIIVAHEDNSIIEKVKKVLIRQGYTVVTSNDGVDTMIKAVKELPFLVILDVALPKIYGFEVCKRLKERAETKEIKVIFISSIYDKTRYKRSPASLYGADDYIEEHQIEEILSEKVDALRGINKETIEGPGEPAIEKPAPRVDAPPLPKLEPQTPPKVQPPAEVKLEAKAETDGAIEKARRLARTIVSDIYLYSSAKMEASIKNNNFYKVFASEIKEGQKLYDSRIPQEVKNKGDFFREAIDNFIEKKKNTLKI
ncbi:MAG: zinc-ribbon domain-containing protein [Nitrospirae bacterium]|nr:zinc-ribbon domain-containing protein [Nitrospirota bacterium]